MALPKFIANEKLEQNEKDLLGLAEQKDKDYMEKTYNELLNYFNNIDTKLVYKNKRYAKQIDMVGKPVKLLGEMCFGESIADIVGLKVAIIASKTLGINEDSVYIGFADGVWEPQRLSSTLRGKHSIYPISPYRIKTAYELSLRSPNTFGFCE